MLLAAGALFAFTFPLADDFNRAVYPRDSGWRPYVIGTTYHRVSGRWAGVGFSAVVLPRVDPTRFYPFLLAALSLAHLGGLLAFWRALTRRLLSWRDGVLLAFGTWALLWAGMPGPGQTVYWFSGAVEYQLSITLPLLLLAWMGLGHRDGASWRRRWAKVLGCAAAALVIPGMHEMVGLTLCLVLAAGVAAAFLERPSHRAVWSMSLGAAVVGLLINVLAPGNAVRAARDFPNRGDLAVVARLTWDQFLDHGVGWILDPKLLAATLFLVVNRRLGACRPRWVESRRVPWRILVPAIWIAAMAAWFAVPSWGTGKPMAPRYLNAAYTVFVIGWFTTVFVLTRQTEPPGEPEHGFLPFLRSAALIVFALALVSTGNFGPVVKMLPRQAPNWHAAMKGRDTAARAAAREGSRHLVIEQGPANPYIGMAWDLASSPKSWRNRSFAAFYGLESVKATPAPKKH